MSDNKEIKDVVIENIETVPSQPKAVPNLENAPEDLAATMFQLFLPRFRTMVDTVSKRKLLRFLETFVSIPELSETNLTDEIKQQILDVKEHCFKDFNSSIRHPNLGTKALRRLTKMIVEFPIEGDNYKLNNAFEEKCFNLANNLLQAKFTVFLNNMIKFEELQNSLNAQVKDLEKEILLLANKLMYAKFIMILHTIETRIGETNESEKV